jgi:hypothetical protein
MLPACRRQPCVSPICTSCRINGEDAFGYYFAFVILPGRMEAQAPVEAFRAVLVWVVAHRQPMLSAPYGLMTEGFDREPSVTFALAPGADVQPPQVAAEQRILMFRGKCGHDEADQLAAIVNQPWPCDIGHRVGIGQGPGDRGNEVFLIRPHLQFAGSPDVFLRYLLQPQPRVHIPTLRRPSGCSRVRRVAWRARL